MYLRYGFNHVTNDFFCPCIEVRAQILGGSEKIVKAGSTVELKCDFSDSTEEPDYVFWYQASAINFLDVLNIAVHSDFLT
jgi:hypothetical protein